ncbi:MAG: hypothetical protein V1742_06865 [Pseudomonadota bacterium]
MAIDRKTSLPKSWGITLEMMENPQCRIPFIEPGNIPEELREELTPLYQNILDKWGTVPRFVQMLAHSPVTIEAWQLIESKIRFTYLKTDPDFVKILQLVIVKTAILNHSNNCCGHNVDLGRSVGLSWDQIDALDGDGWKTSSALSPKERAAVRWADAVTKGTAYDDEEAFQELTKYFTTRQIVEMTYLCGLWNLSGRLTEPFRQTVEPPEKRIGFKDK